MFAKNKTAAQQIAARWQFEVSDDETLSFARRLASIFAARAGVKGEQFLALVDSGAWDAVLSFDPLLVAVDHHEYAALAQAQACFSKLVCLPNGVDRRGAAIKKFLDGEYRCGSFNRLFSMRSEGKFSFSSATESILHSSSRKIASILADVPDIRDVPLRYSVGGATTTIRKKDSDLRNLISGSVHCSEETQANLSSLEGLLTSLPHLVDHFQDAEGMVYLQVVSGVLNFVPKNAKTDRGVTNEPDLTKLIQIGYGDVMRNRMKRYGIDLTDSERQQVLAREGSITGGIATLDLSNASGLISCGLVNDQFPEPWLDVFYWARTGDIYIPELGTTRSLMSYGGMGNGLVFPLETILFHCITEACCEYEGIRYPIVSTYGDDIIVSSGAAKRVIEVLEEIGLKINSEKSFVDGPFRESCGSDWYSGYDVRPIFMRHNLSLEHLYSLHNQFVAKGDEEVCDWLLSHIPIELRMFGPPDTGDGHLWCTNWRDLTNVKYNGGLWSYESVGSTPNVRYVVTRHDWLVPLISAHAVDKEVYLDDSGKAFRRILGTSWELPHGFRLSPTGSKGYRLFNAACNKSPSCLTSTEVKQLRDYALSFEASQPMENQTPKQRRRRGWSIRYQGVDRPSDDLVVFGTELPGSVRSRPITSYIFG